jgi:hypothetical protein
MKNFTRKFIGLLIIAFTLFISQSYAQLSLHVNTTTNSVYFSNSFPVSVSVYDFNLVSSTPWSVTTSSGIDFGSYGCNNETFGDGSSAYMCGIHSGYWEPYASGLISLDGQPLYSGSGSAGGIGNNVIYIDYTSSDQANGIPVEGNVYNISGGGQSTSVPSGNRHIAYMAPQTIEYIYAEAHTGGGNMTSIPVYINGQLLEQDCAGTWGGSSVNDACGVCDGDNSSCSGCTSSWASNYDQDATIDDESCVLSGCTDQTAINYNQNATDDDGSCIALILGCMDAEAVNYDANANTDNGMCQPYTLADVESAEDAAYADGLVAGFADGHADGVIYGSPILIDAIIDLPEGWSMFGYTCIESMNVIDGFSEIASNIVIVKDEWGLAYLPSYGFSAFDNLEYGEGYQIKMTEEVDSFYFCQTHTLKIYGCIDETALNYNSGANTDDGSCIAAVTGCMDESALNYHPGANTDDASCIEVVLGCMDETACNLNDVANTEDDSCLYLEEGFDCDGNCLNPNSAGVCEGFEIFGCTDSDGWNYNSLANTEDTCLYIDVEVDIPSYDAVVSMLACLGSEANYNEPWENLCENESFQTIASYDYYLHEGSSDLVESCIFDGPYGQQYCDDALENEFIELISVLTGTCYASDACNYLEQGICDYTSCVGCQDPTAFNYDAEATVASECIPFIQGCIDPAACNFESEANTSDESCYNNNLGCGCDNPAPLAGLNCEGTAIQIGDELYGGMVFQINDDGTGLVVSMEDIEVMTWSNANNAAANATTEGYEDWYLPNINQLELLYNTIGPGGDNSLGLVYQDGQYSTHWKFWSSSITPSNSNYVYILNFVDGAINENYYPQNWKYSSRAIRAF